MPCLVQFAAKYCEQNDLRKTPVHGSSRFVRLTGQGDVDAISTDTLCHFRQSAKAAGLSPWTIEKTITDVMTLVHKATGKHLQPGRRLRRPRPQPAPAPIEAIEAIWIHAQQWLRQWLVLAYWTGLRLADSITLIESLTDKPRDILQHRAHKTGHLHCWPVPQWLRPWTTSQDHQFPRCRVNAGKDVRTALWVACELAGVATLHPKQLRQRAVTEWGKANGMAGAILHGSGLRVLGHYVDPLSVLESAAPQVRLPACFGASSDTADRMSEVYRRLDQQGQELVLHTAERMVR